MGRMYHRHTAQTRVGQQSQFSRRLSFGCLVLIFGFGLVNFGNAELTVDDVHSALGGDFELLNTVPGRPWVEEQHRYEVDGVLISCNFVAGRCLWIDYWSKGKTLNENFVFGELEKLFPGAEWKSVDQSGKLKRWLNEHDDRVTLRSTGFTLHMNEYIRNVLSRRAQWQF